MNNKHFLKVIKVSFFVSLNSDFIFVVLPVNIVYDSVVFWGKHAMRHCVIVIAVVKGWILHHE